MRLEALKGAWEAKDIDLQSDQDVMALGKEVADKCVVLVDQPLDVARLHRIQTLWGNRAPSIIHALILRGALKGRHWNSVRMSIIETVALLEDQFKDKVSVVTYQTNEKGRPQGIFTNGKLGWHSDQVTLDDGQRVIGLCSAEHTEGSQTAFLCTAAAYDKLNHEDRSMVDELKTVYRWNEENFTGDLIPQQKQIVRYNQTPVDGMSCSLMQETASGRRGIHFPGSLFSHFIGMNEADSLRFKDHIWEKINQPEYIYTHNWKDGQVVYMDQNITLHARPTDVKAGNQRKMWRCISYMDNLFPGRGHNPVISINGNNIEVEDFIEMVDSQRRQEYERQKSVH